MPALRPAGGVLLGAALNAAPELWGAAVLRCAQLELLHGSGAVALPPGATGPGARAAAEAAALDGLCAHEADEWGRPWLPEERAALEALCPTAGVREGVAGGWRAAVLASCGQQVRRPQRRTRLHACRGSGAAAPA